MKNKNLAIVVILVILFIGALTFQLEAQTNSSPNILLITIDSLRPDHLGCYGYSKNTSPNIDKFAKDGVIFTQAIAQASWTLPSMVSIVSSAYPSTHKVYTWYTSLSSKIVTLAQLLKGYGYYNFFCSGHNKALSAILGHQGGFDKWTDNEDLISADKVNEYALKFLKENYERKFLLWIHYMETHDHFMGVSNESKNSLDMSLKNRNILKYDTAITQVDSRIGLIIGELRKLNIDKNTIVIITADHGEEMCEHGLCFNHGGFLWDPVILVPLIIIWKGHFLNNHIKNNQVQHIDIAATVCDILKIKKPSSFEGQSLLPIISGNQSDTQPAFSEHQEKEGDIKDGAWVYTKFSVRLDDWKLIYTFGPRENGYSLYNLKNDPREMNNLSELEEVQFESLKEKLDTWIKRSRINIVPLEKPLEDRTKKKLRTLGYLQ